MIDPALELQVAIVGALKAHTALAAIVATRVYDAVPPSADYPYVSLGQPQVLPDKADCIDGSITVYTIHGWSSDLGRSVEIKRIGAAIGEALDENEFTLNGHRVVIAQHEQTNYLDDPDGITKHVAVTLRFSTEPTD